MDAPAERRQDDRLYTWEPARLFGQQTARTRHEHRPKPRSIQMRHRVERHFLRSAELEFRDDMANGVHVRLGGPRLGTAGHKPFSQPFALTDRILHGGVLPRAVPSD